MNEFEAVVEFGGGYGSLLRVFANLGFSGRYHIHDLPEFGALQRFYYSSILDLRGPALKDPPDATFSSDPREAEEVVSTNFGGTLFVATWSLSEAPLETRERWRPVLDEVQYFLIAYQPVFAGIDNERWFAELRSSRPDVTWAVAPVPRASGDRYLVGAAGG